MTFHEDSERVATALWLGRAHAEKRGRNSRWPYVPIIDYDTHTNQIRGRAYATREEAMAYAQLCIDKRRADFLERLRDPRYRALRVQHGLPMELA